MFTAISFESRRPKIHIHTQSQKPLPERDYWFCPTYNGNPCNFRSLTQLWKKLIKKSEVPDIRFHDLRHTHATLMLKQGIHPKIVSERLEHKKVGITLDTYSHVVPGLQENAVDQFLTNYSLKKFSLEVFVFKQKHHLNNFKYYK